MGDMWRFMKATWRPKSDSDWNKLVALADDLGASYNDPMVNAMIKDYVDEMERLWVLDRKK